MVNIIRRLALGRVRPYVLPVFIVLLIIGFIPWTGMSLELSKKIFLVLGALIMLALGIVSALRARQARIPLHPIAWSFGLPVLAAVISAIAAMVPSESMLGTGLEPLTVGFLILMWLLIGIGALAADSPERLVRLYRIILGSIGVVIVFQYLRIIIGGAFFGRFFGTATSNLVGRWNDFGILAALAVVIILGLLQFGSKLGSTPRLAVRLASGVIGVLALGILVLVNFTGLWLMLGLTALLMYLYGLLAASRAETPASRPVVTVALIVALIAFAGAALGRPAGILQTTIGAWNDRWETANFEVRPSFGGTGRILRATLAESPLLGSGPNTFSKQWATYRPTVVNLTPFWGIDFSTGFGTIPTWMAITGLAGIIGWLAFLSFFFLTALRVYTARGAESPERTLAALALFPAGFLLALAFIYPSETVILSLLALLIGFFIASMPRRGVGRELVWHLTGRSRAGIVGTTVLAAGLVAVAVGAYFFLLNLTAQYLFQRASVVFNATGDVARVERLLDGATRLSPRDTYYRGLLETGLVAMRQTLGKTGVPADTLRTEFQQQLLVTQANVQSAIALDQGDYQNWVALGTLYEALIPLKVDQAYEQAVLMYQEAMKRNPLSPQLWLNLARARVASDAPGSVAAARADAKKALEIKPNFTDALYFLARLDLNSGNRTQALARLKTAVQAAPTDPTAWFQLGLFQYASENYTDARSSFGRALLLAPDFANAQYFSALALDQLGHHAEAKGIITELLQSNPGNQELRTALDNITAGRPATDAPPTL